MFRTVPLSIIESLALYTQHPVGFFNKKFVTLHGHMSVKFISFNCYGVKIQERKNQGPIFLH